jgi:hypothetical protein
MNKIILIILCLTFTSYSNLLLGQTSNLKEFETFLGKEKTAALNKLNVSFDNFLLTNYPKIESENESIYKYLETFQDWSVVDKEWILDYDLVQETLNKFENSGLRIEFWKFKYESYSPNYLIDSLYKPIEDSSNLKTLNSLTVDDIEEEIIPITNEDYDPELEKKLKRQRDSSQSFNRQGQFVYGLTKYGLNDTLIEGYVDAKYSAGDISPALIVGGLTFYKLDLSTPLRKRIILMEFYYHFLQWNLEDKKMKR